MRIKKGDQVVVLTGREKGKSGEVLRVDLERNRVLVQGVNMVKRHERADPDIAWWHQSVRSDVARIECVTDRPGHKQTDPCRLQDAR